MQPALPEKRKRVKVSRFDFDFLDNEEQLLIQHALKISKYDTKVIKQEELPDIPYAPTFYPTEEEFIDAIGYIQKIKNEAEKFGICKIIPPKKWKLNCNLNLNSKKKFPTKNQVVNQLQQGKAFDDGEEYTFETYKNMANNFYSNWLQKNHPEYYAKITALEDKISKKMDPSDKEELNSLKKSLNDLLCKDYWEMVETNNKEAIVDYGNDLDTLIYGSGFPKGTFIFDDNDDDDDDDLNTKTNSTNSVKTTSSTMSLHTTSKGFESPDFYSTTDWNLNNIAFSDKSVLKHIQTNINGVNVPWLYVGMLFSSFCWHTEDNYLYSINYSHFGNIKQWYGVSGANADEFERISNNYLLGLFRQAPDILHHMTTQISPYKFYLNNLPIYQIKQEPGSFVITFPRSYHGGFSYGFNIGEAVNFGSLDWLYFGNLANKKYSRIGRESILCYNRLLFTILNNIIKTDIYEKKVIQENIDGKEGFQYFEDFDEDLKELIQLENVINQNPSKNIESIKLKLDSKLSHSNDLLYLINKIVKVINDELQIRKSFLNLNYIDTSKFLKLKVNKYDKINNKTYQYDEQRECLECKQVCILSGLGCQCNNTNIVCLRHYNNLCKCNNKEKKFLLYWETNQWLINKIHYLNKKKQVIDKHIEIINNLLASISKFPSKSITTISTSTSSTFSAASSTVNVPISASI